MIKTRISVYDVHFHLIFVTKHNQEPSKSIHPAVKTQVSRLNDIIFKENNLYTQIVTTG